MPLTDTALRQAKARPTLYRLYDARGLCIEVTSTGSKRWRFRYAHLGKEKSLSLGLYPDVPLARAREKRDAMRVLLADGVDPSVHRKAQAAAAVGRAANSFEVIAREWYVKQAPTWEASHGDRVIKRLEKHVFPWLGSKPITSITPPDLMGVLKRPEGKGHNETAHRTAQICSAVFRYAIASGRAETDPTRDLRGAIAPTKTKHHASITEPAKIGELLRAIDGYDGFEVVRAALRLVPHVFVRSGELRNAEWSEFDLPGAEWSIPKERMKMKQPHIVPLSTQSLAILDELKREAGTRRLVFPGTRGKDRPLSNNTLNAALRRIGYGPDEMTTHGFRSMASTRLHERGFNRDWVERQLAHAEGSKVRAAYNYAEHLPERRKMMQSWSDYLDELRLKKPSTAATAEPEVVADTPAAVPT
jgi:integrase